MYTWGVLYILVPLYLLLMHFDRNRAIQWGLVP